MTMAVLGKWGVSANWSFLYMITSEVYPTRLRSIGLASCSMMGRIGGIFSPFISEMVRLVTDPLDTKQHYSNLQTAYNFMMEKPCKHFRALFHRPQCTRTCPQS